MVSLLGPSDLEFSNYVNISAFKIIKINITTISFYKMAGEFDSHLTTHSAYFNIIPLVGNIVGKIQFHIEGHQLSDSMSQDSTFQSFWFFLFSFLAEIEVSDFPCLYSIYFRNS